MTYQLRPYQKEAVQAVLDNLKENTADLIVLPTGSGKSLVIADSAERIGEPVLILSPSREITAQNQAKMATYRPKEEIGIYSASFKSKQVRRYTFATIQSIYKKPELFKHFKYVFIDEAHSCGEKGIRSMFNQFFRGLDSIPKIIGFTATPYRIVRDKPIFKGDFINTIETTRMITSKDLPWSKIIYCKNYSQLKSAGFLSPIEYHQLELKNKSLTVGGSISKPLLDMLRTSTVKHKGTIVFCKNLSQAQTLSQHVPLSACVDSKTSIKNRDQIINDFKSGEIKILFNYESLLTGFDAPHIDCIYLLRKFSSVNQYVQAVGRGTRLSEGKDKCLVVDCVNNTGDFESLHTIELQKTVGGYILMKGLIRLDEVKKTTIVRNPKSYRQRPYQNKIS